MTVLLPIAAARAVAAMSLAWSLATLTGCETATAGGAVGAQLVLGAGAAQKDAAIARRCPQCGWIQSKRAILPDVANPHAPMVYEYTVRMADGSSSVFREERASWRLGERLMVIAGSGTLD